MSQISAQYCDGLEVRIKELQAENAALKNKLEMAEACLAGDGALIEGLKAEIQALNARLIEQEHAAHIAYGDTIDALKAELEQWQRSVCDQGEVIENLKAELAAWKNVFGHLGTADECGNEWIALQDKLAAAQRVEPVDLNPDTFMRLIKTIKYLVGIAERGEGKKIADDETPEQFVLGYVKKLEQSEFRAGMLAAAEIAKKFEPDERDGVYFPSDAIREAAKK